MNKYLKNALLTLTGIAGIVLSVITGKAAMKGYKEFNEERKERYLKEQANKQEFEQMKRSFKIDYNETHIVKLTLDNPKIANGDDRSYLYDKFNSMKQSALSCSYYDRGNYQDYVQECIDLEYILDQASSDAINAKLCSLRKQDEENKRIAEKEEAFMNEEYKHKRELEILESKRQADLDVYKAKLNVEQAKLKTICEAMGNSSNKNVNSTLNIKTDISED